MKYNVITDKDGYIESIFADEKGIEIDISGMKLQYLFCYRLEDGKVVLDESKYNAIISDEEVSARIAELQSLLASTDYIQDGLISGLLQLKNPLTFVTDLIALLSSTLTEYPVIIAQRAEWIAELKGLKK